MGFDPVSYLIGRRAGRAAADPLKSWSELRLWLRAGQLGQVLEAGDQLNVEVGGTARDFDVLGLDEDVPVGAGLSHVLSIQSRDVLNGISFDMPMYLFAVTEEACAAFGWPSAGASAGMPAGTYHLTLLNGAFNGGADQDGTYQVTTTQIIPIGGGIRHSTMGVLQSGGYSKAQILGGTFTTYGADTTTVIESGLPTSEGSGGADLGTTTAKDPQYKSGDYINFTKRQAGGSGRWKTSYIRQYLNSSDAELRFVPATIWSRNADSVPEGFLHTIEPALREVLGKVRKRYALSVADGSGYEDVEDWCTLSTMLDIGLGNNGTIPEGPVNAESVVTRTTAYSLWDETSQGERIKYRGAAASNWWLGSTYRSDANVQQCISASGELRNGGASNSYGPVPNLYII